MACKGDLLPKANCESWQLYSETLQRGFHVLTGSEVMALQHVFDAPIEPHDHAVELSTAPLSGHYRALPFGQLAFATCGDWRGHLEDIGV
jgi:hypothetical protein